MGRLRKGELILLTDSILTVCPSVVPKKIMSTWTAIDSTTVFLRIWCFLIDKSYDRSEYEVLQWEWSSHF